MAVTDRLQGLNIGAAVKPSCVVATTGSNITLSGAQTIDGISVGSCERVLVKDQTDETENGIWRADSSSWVRTADFDGARDAIPGTLVYVDRGTTYATSFWAFNSSSTATKITIGTDDVTASRVTIALAGVTSFSQDLLALATATSWRSSDGLDLGSASTLDSSDIGLLTSTGLAWVGIQSLNKGGDLASANGMTLGSTGNYFDVTGGTTINTIAAVRIGTKVGLHFDSTLVLTHSTALVLPSSANISVRGGDEAEFTQYTTAADWRLTSLLTHDGRGIGAAALVPASTSQMAAENTSTALAVTPGVMAYHSGHPKAVVRVDNATSTNIAVTTVFSAVGTLTATRNTTGEYTVSWGTSLTNAIPHVTVVARSTAGPQVMSVISSGGIGSTHVSLINANAATGTVIDSSGFLMLLFGDL